MSLGKDFKREMKEISKTKTVERRFFEEDFCPECGSINCYKDTKKDKYGERTAHTAEIILCRECRAEFPNKKYLKKGKEYFTICGGYQWETEESMIYDLLTRMSKKQLLMTKKALEKVT